MRSALQFRQVCSPSPTKWSNRARFCCMALRSLLALFDRSGRSLVWSISGEERTFGQGAQPTRLTHRHTSRPPITALQKVQGLSGIHFRRAIGRRSSKTFDYCRRSWPTGANGPCPVAPYPFDPCPLDPCPLDLYRLGPRPFAPCPSGHDPFDPYPHRGVVPRNGLPYEKRSCRLHEILHLLERRRQAEARGRRRGKQQRW
jgi:hypothetical protein